MLGTAGVREIRKSFRSEMKQKSYLKKLGNRIVQTRKRKKLGQDLVTSKSGLAIGTVSKIERGLVDARITTLSRIAKALKVSVGEPVE